MTVLITPEEFDRMPEQDAFLAAVREGLADAEAGQLIEDEEVECLLRDEFGPPEPK